ncbi:FG-GAP repeat protein [Chloroflexi bacterium TSY]|nr:FG-GAP repeat protein [Chloroflexi bacterium TSY]
MNIHSLHSQDKTNLRVHPRPSWIPFGFWRGQVRSIQKASVLVASVLVGFFYFGSVANANDESNSHVIFFPFFSYQVIIPIPPFADFDGDGYSDLAIGIPEEDVRDIPDAGAVIVLFGSSGGIDEDDDQRWDQDTPGISGSVERDDQFGRAVAAGDFNDDGFTDLAIGAPYENLGDDSDAGAVNILYGSTEGLDDDDDQRWSQDSSGIADDASDDDQFGRTLIAADFNGDRYADLAIGAPEENIDGESDAGAVNVLYGTSTGLTASGNQFWHQNSFAIFDVVENKDRFGQSLAAGDFNRDGYADLAVGVPEENIGATNAGAVHVLYGSPAGLNANGNQLWHQDSPGIEGSGEHDDKFGKALVAGDFNGDGLADLAIGIAEEDIEDENNAGAVTVLYGSPFGLTVVGSQKWHQDSSGISGSAESGDQFGRALAAGDFNGDGYDELAIGVPEEDVNGASNAGAVNILYGSPVGLSANNEQRWDQSSSGVAGSAESGDQFGRALTTGDYNQDGCYVDLAIGVPFEDIEDIPDAGAVNILYGTASGLSSRDDQRWDQNTSGIDGSAESGDHFGQAIE